MNKLLKDEAKDNKPINPLKALTPLQENVLDCLRKGITIQREIGEKLGKPQPHIAECIKALRKKGYNIGKYGDIKENMAYGTANAQV